MNIAIIGAGLIGNKRAAALKEYADDKVVAVCDTDIEKARELAARHGNDGLHGCDAVADWRDAVLRDDVDIVINAAINSVLEEVTVAALEAGKHVLCEKPLGRNAGEAHNMLEAAERRGLILKTGFNHRFHPGLWRAKELVDEDAIGDLLSIRARYGHGSRPGMEKEWRSSKQLCGGGELLDQGVHVIDLLRWFAGEVAEVYARVETRFWDIEVEDNAFAILKMDGGVTASFHVSWTNWRNVFSFEIFGTQGYIYINGLGGSYGPETLEFGKRKPEGGRPDIETIEYPAEDVSWTAEWKEFRAAIVENRAPLGSGRDGLMANHVIEALYRSSAENAAVAPRGRPVKPQDAPVKPQDAPVKPQDAPVKPQDAPVKRKGDTGE